MKNIIFLILILISLSCNKNTREEQKPTKQEVKKPVSSYVIVLYDVSYYELNDPLDMYPFPEPQIQKIISKIKEVKDLNDEKKAKLKDEFLIKVNRLLKIKNDKYLENLAILESNNFYRDYGSPLKLEASKIEGYKDNKTEIHKRAVKVFNTYKEASDFSFKFN